LIYIVSPISSSAHPRDHLWLRRLLSSGSSGLLNESDSFLDIGRKVLDTSFEKSLLVVGNLAYRVNLLNTTGSKLNVGCEVLAALVLVERAVNKCWLDDTRLTLLSLEQALSETSSSHGHGESGRSSTTLGLDNLITTELDTLDVCVTLTTFKVMTSLREERNNGSSGVTTDDSDVLVSRVGTLNL